MLLAGDLGATKTLLGLFDLVDGRPTAVEVRRYETHAFASGTALLDQFWQDIGRGAPVAAAGFGVAGPVVGDTVRLTNVPWTATVAELQAACLGAPVAVVNDVAAIAHSLDVLDAGDLVTLQPGHRIPLAPVSILAVGTGLGAATVVRIDGRRVVLPSETGHADFSPRSDIDVTVLQALRRARGRVAIEDVVSGTGLAAIYDVLHDGQRCQTVGDRARADVPAATTAGAMAGACARCADTLDLFVRAWGAEAGNVALRTLPYGGLVLAGGVAAKLLAPLSDGRFLQAFLAKAPMEAVLERVPVLVLTNERAGLVGAAVVAAESVGLGTTGRQRAADGV